MEALLLILLVIIAVIIVGSSVSKTKREIRKHTKPPREKKSYQSPQKISQVAYKTKAQSAAEVKERIEDFPKVKVQHVIDGDTVIVVKSRNKIKIRLDSIDCPEQSQEWGKISKYGLIKLIGGQKVRLEEHGIDPHKRALATLYVQHGNKSESEWMNVNERMVTLGHAWVMRRFYDHLPKDRQAKLNRLERWARSKKVGLWKSSNQIPPWKWRREG